MLTYRAIESSRHATCGAQLRWEVSGAIFRCRVVPARIETIVEQL
jgi:hypothetical protein